jgi:hypothetical protein
MLKKIIIGVIAGIVSGVFSTGGGMILLPAFIYLLKMNEKEARATSITCILPMVLTTSIFYAKNNYINLEAGIFCAVGGIIGGFFGSKFLNKIPDWILKTSFIVFLVYMGIKLIVQ